MSTSRTGLGVSSAVKISLLIAIITWGFGLRVFKLGEVPKGLFCDEAANGYDALCLLETGRNAHGDFMPLVMNHHGIDFVEGMYTYLTIPPVAVLGLSPTSTRLISALVGTLTILSTYLLAKELFGGGAALIAAFLVSVSPWHLVFSRIGFRVSLLPFFMTLAVWLFLRSLNGSRYLIPTGLVFGLALHTYAVARALVPLVLVTLLILYWKEVWHCLSSSRWECWRVAGALLVFAGLAVPSYLVFVFGSAGLRFESVSIFGHPSPLRRFMANYLLQINPLFLFFEGDFEPRANMGGLGLVLPALIPPVLIGAVLAFRQGNSQLRVPGLLFLMGAIPPALTAGGNPMAIRGIGAVPYLEVFAAGAFVSLLVALGIEKRRFAVALLFVLAILTICNAGIVVTKYFRDYASISAYGFQFGLEQAIRFVERHRENYDLAVFSPRINQAYIFPLFFGSELSDNVREIEDQPGYLFLRRPVKRLGEGRYLVVARDCEVIEGVPSVERHVIRGPDGSGFIRLLEIHLEQPDWVGIGKRRPCARQPALIERSRLRRFTENVYRDFWRVVGIEEIRNTGGTSDGQSWD